MKDKSYNYIYIIVNFVFLIVYVLISLIYTDYINLDVSNYVSNVDNILLIYYSIIAIHSIIYPMLVRKKYSRSELKNLLKHYIVLMMMSNITCLYITIFYALKNYNVWGIDYESLAWGFVYFVISIFISITFYMCGIGLIILIYFLKNRRFTY